MIYKANTLQHTREIRGSNTFFEVLEYFSFTVCQDSLGFAIPAKRVVSRHIVSLYTERSGETTPSYE